MEEGLVPRRVSEFGRREARPQLGTREVVQSVLVDLFQAISTSAPAGGVE